MKTKEIDVWVRPDEIDSNGISCQTNRHDKWQIKAKLIIEIPEKKIEITESELKYHVENCIGDAEDVFYRLKKELGF